MKILFTSEEVIDICNGKYYSMNLGQHLAKYSYFGQIVCVCYYRNVDETKLPEVDQNAAEFVFTDKVNHFSALFATKKRNDHIIKEQVERKDIDMLVCHVPSGNSRHAIKYAKKNNKPYLEVVVGCAWDALWNYDWRGKCIAIPYYLNLRKIVRKAPFALYVTEHFLQKRYPCDGETEHASNVCIEKVSDSVLANRIKRIDSYTKDTPLKIMTTAAVSVRYKGQEYVIRALSKLNKELGFNYHYYMVGAGDQSFLRGVAKEVGVEEFVHFIGPLPHDKVTEMLDDMDLYIQPSKQEGLPRALIEGMSRALPAVGTRVAGIPELLGDDYLVKKGSVDDIIEVLSTKMNKECMKEQARVNYAKASEYTLDIINARRQAFFDKFVHHYFKRNDF